MLLAAGGAQRLAIYRLPFPRFRKEDERRYFDDDYYRAQYDDVSLPHVNRFAHFMMHGWREGRNPSPDFVTLFYRDKYLAGENVNPLTHYVREGRKAGLRTEPASEDEYLALQYPLTKSLFSSDFYARKVDETVGDPLMHYLRSGWRDRKPPSPEFDPDRYLAEHIYIGKMDVCPLYHLASQTRLLNDATRLDTAASATAISDRRDSAHIKKIVAEEFDCDFYLRHNDDVRVAGKDPLTHFLDCGWSEGRKPNALFDCSYYLRTNPDVAAQAINPFYHYLTLGRSLGLATNPVGPRLYAEMRAPSDADWDSVASAVDTASAECVIIMPVYKGREETLASIHAILSARQVTKFALHIINDQSPDLELDADLIRLASKRLAYVSTNTANLGFVKSVNGALRRYPDKDVILINTDAKVYGDWLDRIVAHARRDPTIATITPFTNNATIFSYPLINTNNVIEMERDAASLDRLAAICNSGRVSDAPVGVGFCLFVSASSRASVGLLDEEAFGRGYGEENDFCLRAAKAGFRNVLAEDVFVYHVGEVSFGSADRSKSPPGQKALLAKHPEYPELIRQHLLADPTEEGRMRLDLMRLAADAGQGAVVFVYHALEGGIVTHVEDEEARLRDAGVKVIHLRVAVKDRWGIEIRSGSKPPPFCPNLQPRSFLQMRPLLVDFLGWLKPRAIHIHSLVDFDWYATQGFLALVRESGVPYRFTLHDYSVVCHRNNLVRPSGRYCGLPDEASCRACVAKDATYPEAIDPAVRRQTFSAFLKGAEEVIAPSHDIKTRLERAGADYRIRVRQHLEAPIVAPTIVRLPDAKPIEILTIGALGVHKGSRIVLSLARDARARDLPIRFHIVGYSDVPQDMKKAGVVETGRYSSREEAFDLALAVQPSCIFLPSIWPETYSYTLSMAFALKCPPVVFDIGAPADRVRAEGFGFVLPYDLIDDVKALNERLIEVCEGARLAVHPSTTRGGQGTLSARAP